MANNSLESCLCNFFGAGLTIIILTSFPIAEVIIGALYIYECPVAPVIPVYVIVCGISALVVMGLIALLKLPCQEAPGNTIWTLSFLSLFLFVIIWIIFGSYHIYSVYPPNYNKNLTDTNRVNNSIYSPTAYDDKLPFIPHNQNQSLPSLNHTTMIHNNQTLMKMIQSLAQSNFGSKSNGEQSDDPRVVATVPYCDRTLYLFAFWTTTLVYMFTGITMGITCFFYICLKFFVMIIER